MDRLPLILAGLGGAGLIGYCLYFDRKRVNDPNYKENVMKRRTAGKKLEEEANAISIPPLNDPEAVQRFFFEQVQTGDQLVAEEKYEQAVKHLTLAVQVCSRPNEVLAAFKESLPPPVFQMLIQSIAQMGSRQMETMMRGAGGGGGGGREPASPPSQQQPIDADGLD